MLRLLLLLCLAGLWLQATSPTPPPFTRADLGAATRDGGDSRSVHWIDYDGDGDLDLFVTNGQKGGQSNFLYRNEAGAFVKVTEAAVAQDSSASVAATWGDYDGDGDPDLYVTTWYGTPNPLYRNEGAGRFTRLTEGTIATDRSFGEAASWADYDQDGDLDLYATNSGGSLLNFLYRNDGGTFVRRTGYPAVTDAHPSRAVSWGDYDDDGDLDLFVANEERHPNALYRNTVAETGTPSFVRTEAGALTADSASTMSSNWIDYDNDGDLDLFAANYGANALYRNDGGTFTKVTHGALVTDVEPSFGSQWADYDNDGDLDLFVANAYAKSSVRDALYQNDGDGTFTKITDSPLVTDNSGTYGSAWADYDGDGDLDLFVAKTDGEDNVLFRNDLASGTQWLGVRLVGATDNRSAIGATVHVRARLGGKAVWQRRQVEGQSGYAGQTLDLHFGLGEATIIDELRIVWPCGNTQTLTNVATNQRLTITE